ncbi:hypothetical protein [Dactylosporangium sp. NPDC051541]|uniref:hypothetical protein n=1 Tax=Dactylosporangium sp. NPDC051541 TaxID=3363977 RepID=UPI0037B3ADAF
MVTAARPVTPRPRLAVRLLGVLLPPGIRRRQRDEWAADLADLGPGERRRYLFWAAWTLPALWVAAGRRGLTSPAPAVGAADRGPATTAARVLLFALAWPALSWVLAVPVPLLFHDRLARLETPWTIPVQAVLVLGAYAMISGGIGLVFTFGLSAIAVGATHRARAPRHRGLVLLAGLIGVATAIVLAPHGWPNGPGAQHYAYPLAAVATVVFAFLARGLRGRTRAALVVAALIVAAVWLAQRSPTGQDLNAWFMD